MRGIQQKWSPCSYHLVLYHTLPRLLGQYIRFVNAVRLNTHHLISSIKHNGRECSTICSPIENILIFMLSMLLSMATRITLSHAHNCWERLGMKERWWVSSQAFYLPSSSQTRSEHQGICQVILSFLRFTTSNTTRP